MWEPKGKLWWIINDFANALNWNGNSQEQFILGEDIQIIFLLDIVQKEGKFNQNPKYCVNIGEIFAFWAHKNVTSQFSKMGQYKIYLKYVNRKGGEGRPRW
jgi:hypothetical protein